ncbi:DUF4132 domain-containing protein [Aureisphaera galaxeae]|uniref:DUF4132 domain-containing protein n=1 Tax=Aureisphaera galaxeae TaxID=1538023 RepID=UPI0023502739|nr:DUF4132 domain-containing protein [Aureisphaera galaxeae]MDC8005143.1 DUF4132 domain-containing protein [Aureisphaera galaxeae]
MGIKDNLLNLFGGSRKPVPASSPSNPKFDAILNTIIKEVSKQHNSSWWYGVQLGKIESYQNLKAWDNAEKRKLVFYMIPRINQFKKVHNSKKGWSSNDTHWYNYNAYSEILSAILRSNLEFPVAEIKELFNAYKSSDDSRIRDFVDWPVGFSVQQIEKTIKREGLSDELKEFIVQFLKWPQLSQKKSYWGSDLEKVRVKLEKLVFESENTEGRTAPYKLPEDRLSQLINPEIEALKDDEKDLWYELFHLFVKASAAKPSLKFLKATGSAIDKIGIKKYKERIYPWIAFVCALKEVETVHEHTYNGHVYRHSTYELLHEKNTTFLKGLIWSLNKFHDSKTLSLIAQLAERSYRKIPGVGPAAAGVGNACIYVLGHTKGLEGISHLSRLKLKVKQNNTRKLIEKYLDEASKKLGISASEIEEISIPDFGLKDGIKTYTFNDYTLTLEIVELGKVNLIWEKPDGKNQKTTPSFVKTTTKHTQLLKKAKADVAQIKKYLTAQRDRIDRLYLDDRTWSYEDFSKHYLDHGLVGFISKRLIWEFGDKDKTTSALYENGEWKNASGETLKEVNSQNVRLWHPINSSIDEVLAWRNRLEALELKQPMKQAFREIYVLTDAEVNTRSYSNRMAAHLLKQHQFNALAALRGWKYSLMGAFDNGIDAEMATIQIKSHNLEAQFWINEINADDAMNDMGIWDYVATDQVRFVNSDGEAPDLIDIPKIVFSEIMRNVDLFVGVCSVGNDPEWRDNGGLPQYRDYWTSYSFGELTEVAKTRREILERLLPRLKINKVASIDGKFLRIQGTKRTYKIHIGSTNILMEPNDQYLCIVPARGKDTKTANVFLPFEGDRGLSLILSKAFLLAEDNKIEDTTILTQINR